MHLETGSPCLGAGIAAGASAKTLDGRTRPSPPSVGAYEVISSGAAATKTTLTSSANPSVAGQSVAFIVYVAKSAANTATPLGTVTFAVDGHPTQPVMLSNGYYASYNTSSLPIGSHSITAAYSGDANYAYSASTLTQIVTISPQYVSPSGSDTNSGMQAAPKLTIQAAINATNNGGSVVVEDGTYTGPGNVDLDFGGRNITVKSQNGPTTTIIDCGGSSTENHRGFYLHSGETNVAVGGLTIENGYAGYGGGIDDENTVANTIAISNCVLYGNSAAYGGGIRISNPSNSTVTVAGCVFVDNIASLGGGFCDDGNSNNSSVITLTGCTFAGNAAKDVHGFNFAAGGGIYSQCGGQLTIAKCMFSSNTAQLSTGGPAAGGGAYIYSGTGIVTVMSCSFMSNTASGGGGGFADTADGGSFVISDCEMIGNQASKGGGINTYLSSGGTVSITNCTLTANSASTSLGSGVYDESYSNNGFTTLTNDILYGDSGAEFTFVADNYGFTGVTATAAYCDVQGGYTGTSNINADPLFVLPPFMGASPDLHLRYVSPCVGAGTASGAPTMTIDGMTRSNPPSIGAYEAAVTSTATALSSSLNPSTVGQSVTFTATVTGTSGTSTGTVTFTLDGTAQPPVTLASGQVTLMTSALAAGSHTLIAAYSGDRLNASSTSATLTQMVDTLATTTTTLASSLNPSTYGQQISFTATVTGNTPTGTVTFEDSTTGITLGNVNLSAGSAAFVTASLGAGTHQVIAIYSGDAGNTASISSSVAQVIHAATTTITVTSSVNPSIAGQSVFFGAQIGGAGGGAPSGTVTFTIDGTGQTPFQLGQGIGPGFSTSTLTAGSHVITAAYSGDSNCTPSVSAALTQTVNPPAATAVQINAGGGAIRPFSADTDFSGGSAYATSAAISTAGVTNPAPAAVYQSERYGNFSYVLPNLTPGGSYSLRLHFAEIYWNSAGQRVFNVTVNGNPVLSNFDIFAAAGGADKAVVESFPVQADSTGKVTAVFTTVKDNAKLSGLEIVAAPVTQTTVAQINAGGGVSGSFTADTDFSGSSQTYSTAAAISTAGVTNPAPQAVYQTERYGNFTYTVPNLTPGSAYTLRLHFAENYWTAANKRLFNVSVNGASVLANFDIFTAAGGANKAVVETFAVTADSSGKVAVVFAATKDFAKLSGLELLH